MFYKAGALLLTRRSEDATPSAGYSFSYDGLNRLVAANFQYGLPGTTTPTIPTFPSLPGTISPGLPNLFQTPNYTESFGYDKMGNILSLQRWGLLDNNNYGMYDNLTLSYYGNCLLARVDDAVSSQSSADVMEFKNGYNDNEEYYYLNGKQYADYNKKICQTRYNYLALPQLIQFRYGHQIKYSYDAAGVKRRVTHIESASNKNLPPDIDISESVNPTPLLTTKTDYIDNKIYENGYLKRILTENGYIDKNGNNYTYHYYIKDHLGNNRIVIDQAGNVKQLTNYYPSGTVMANRRTDQGVQPFKFSGKELDCSNGLDFYDFEWRTFDPTLMRFTTPDPLMEKYYGISPYVYCANNPVRFVDRDGKDPTLPFSPFSKKMEQVIQLSTIASENGKDAFSASISLEAAAYKTGAKIEAGPISAEANLKLGSGTAKISTDDVSVTGTAASATIKASSGNESIQANASIGTLKVSVNENLDVKTQTSAASGSVRVNAGERYGSVDNNSKVSVGAQLGPLKAELSVKLEKAVTWFVATVAAIGAMITPETKVPDEVKR